MAETKADDVGQFDFGRIDSGHYHLVVKERDVSDWFDIEITNKVRTTQDIRIDISPVYPDGQGGHEFILYN